MIIYPADSGIRYFGNYVMLSELIFGQRRLRTSYEFLEHCEYEEKCYVRRAECD